MATNKTYAQTKWNTSKRTASIEYIVIHNTGTTASAVNNCKYFGSGDRQASADFFVDTDGKVYQFNADVKGRFTWHCGDGNGKYGITNNNSIGIECVSKGSEFTALQKEALKSLVKELMATYGAKQIVRHYDASKKQCPSAYCGSSAKDSKWKELKAYLLANEPKIYATGTVYCYGTNKQRGWRIDTNGTFLDATLIHSKKNMVTDSQRAKGIYAVGTVYCYGTNPIRGWRVEPSGKVYVKASLIKDKVNLK